MRRHGLAKPYTQLIPREGPGPVEAMFNITMRPLIMVINMDMLDASDFPFSEVKKLRPKDISPEP